MLTNEVKASLERQHGDNARVISADRRTQMVNRVRALRQAKKQSATQDLAL